MNGGGGERGEPVRIKANALLIISPDREARGRVGGGTRAKKNTERAEVMREAVEYARGRDFSRIDYGNSIRVVVEWRGKGAKRWRTRIGAW